MKRNRFTMEQIIRMLREAEVHLSQRKSPKFCLWKGERIRSLERGCQSDFFVARHVTRFSMNGDTSPARDLVQKMFRFF
jgi:hypothetical protein